MVKDFLGLSFYSGIIGRTEYIEKFFGGFRQGGKAWCVKDVSKRERAMVVFIEKRNEKPKLFVRFSA
jgi:hypothetical protein